MTSTPITTRSGPDQERLRTLMRRLADVESPDAPVLSVYLDYRPEASGEAPARRKALTVLRDRLRDIEQTLPAHGSNADSFRADAERIRRFLDEGDVESAEGIAIFACSAHDIWEVVRSGTPFETQISAGPLADLFQLARLLEDAESAIVALVDTNTCRLFVTRRGRLAETAGPDEPSDEHRRHDQGGWSQARFQRHIDEQDNRFAREVAAAIERLARAEAARRLIIAGEERSTTALEAQLSAELRALLEDVRHVDMHASREQVEAEMLPLLAAAAEAEAANAADRAVAGIRAGDLGVGGVDETYRALEFGQVDELILDETAPIDEELRAELVRQAAASGASVVVVSGHEGVLRFGGVAATLRFKLEPASEG